MAKFKYEKYDLINSYEPFKDISDFVKSHDYVLLLNDNLKPIRSILATEVKNNDLISITSTASGYLFITANETLDYNPNYCLLVSSVSKSGDNITFKGNVGKKIKLKVKGQFLETVTAEDGTYPDNGISGSYWYVKTGKAFPSIKLKYNDTILSIGGGYWKDDKGQLYNISNIYYKDNSGVVKKIK